MFKNLYNKNLKDPKLFEPLSESRWPQNLRLAWCDEKLIIIHIIMHKLHIDTQDSRYWPAYNLAKNLWYDGCTDEDIEKELIAYILST